MNMKLKKTLAVLVPVFGIATIGAVSAQVLDPAPAPAVTQEETLAVSKNIDLRNNAAEPMNAGDVITAPGSESVPQPAEAPIVTVDTTTTAALEPNESVVVAQAAPPVFVERDPYTVRQEYYRTLVPGLPLPPAASPRSGEGSLEEIATRTNPIDLRASLVPEYLVDHSPGGL